MSSHIDLSTHVATFKADKKFESLTMGEWTNEQGILNVKVENSILELHDQECIETLPKGKCLEYGFKGNINHLYKAPRKKLPKMYLDLKQNKAVKSCWDERRRYFTCIFSEHCRLPTHLFLGKTCKDTSGAVVRDYEDAVFVFPVKGTKASIMFCATVYSDIWEVRESIVRVHRQEKTRSKV